MEAIKARWILPVGAPPLENGVVQIAEGRIIAMGASKDLNAPGVEDLGDVVLMPGLINAHCHLDYSAMRGAIPPQANFAQWIRRINELKQEGEDPALAIAEGFAELQTWGTTSVLNVESFPGAPACVPPTGLRTWWFGELLDIRGPANLEGVAISMRQASERHGKASGGWGLSPHAPYTASENLYESVGRYCREHRLPWTTHLAETEEEFSMFVEASGPLYDFLSDLGRPMGDTGGVTPVARVLGDGKMPPGGLLAHMNYLTAADYELLDRRGADFSVVHCPNCHAYFSRPRFEIERWQKMGVPLCLGTDSLASNSVLNLFEEMRTLRASHPGLPAAEILDMVTRNPARAIGQGGALGEIAVGAHADLIALPFTGGGRDVLEAVLANRSEVEWMMVAGKVKKITKEE